MWELFGYPPKRSNFQMFTDGAGTTDWRAWKKPRGYSLGFFFVGGSGGGGGCGFNGTGAGSARGGGGGGGSGALTRLILPLDLVPDVLYVQPGKGGAGGLLSTNAGATGALSYITFSVGVVSIGNLFAVSGTAAAGMGGAAGTAAGNNGGGVASTAAAQGGTGSGTLGHPLGMWQAIAGQAGAASGSIAGASGSKGISISALNALIITGGAGGGTVGTGNANFDGGDITIGSCWLPTALPGGVGGDAGTATSGRRGYQFIYPNPFCATGGSGGGTAGASGAAGSGGNAGWMCGGGGGGGGVTGGPGGNGGSGLVIIICI